MRRGQLHANQAILRAMENSEPAYRYAEGTEPLSGIELRKAGMWGILFGVLMLLPSAAAITGILLHKVRDPQNVPLMWIGAGLGLLVALRSFWSGIDLLLRYSTERRTSTDQQGAKS